MGRVTRPESAMLTCVEASFSEKQGTAGAGQCLAPDLARLPPQRAGPEGGRWAAQSESWPFRPHCPPLAPCLALGPYAGHIPPSAPVWLSWSPVGVAQSPTDASQRAWTQPTQPPLSLGPWTEG